MSDNKVPIYQLNSADNHRKKKLVIKNISFNVDKDWVLIEKIKADENQSFNALVKSLLRKHYGIDQESGK